MIHPSKFGADLLIYMSVYCENLEDVVKLWIAFGLHKHIPSYDRAWREVLRFWLLINEKGDSVEDACLRMGCRLDSGGLLLIERACVPRKCSRSGCFVLYKEIENGPAACSWHNGKMVRGSLTCCKQTSFKDEGCKRGWHDGALFESIYTRREKITEDSDDEDVYYTGSSALDVAVGMVSKEFIGKSGIDGSRSRNNSKRRSSGALSALLALQMHYHSQYR